jgi:hypothetical protein
MTRAAPALAFSLLSVQKPNIPLHPTPHMLLVKALLVKVALASAAGWIMLALI